MDYEFDIHPDQEVIPPDGPYLAGSAGHCYWCGELATYANLDILIPKKPRSPRTLVSACAVHYAKVVKPALDREKEKKAQGPWTTTRS